MTRGEKRKRGQRRAEGNGTRLGLRKGGHRLTAANRTGSKAPTQHTTKARGKRAPLAGKPEIAAGLLRARGRVLFATAKAVTLHDAPSLRWRGPTKLREGGGVELGH